MTKKNVENIPGLLDKIAASSGHMVLGQLDKDLRTILTGGGSSGTSDNLTEKACSATWKTISTDARVDIESVIDALRRGSKGVVAVAGWDVLRTLSKNTSIINNGDRVRAGWMEVQEALLEMGIERVIVDTSVQQNGERQAARSYKGILDGVFALTTAENMILGELNALNYDIYEDKDRRTFYFRAAMDVDIVRGYAEHGYYFSGHMA